MNDIYLFSNGSTNFANAETACDSVDAKLASYDTEDEHSLLVDKMKGLNTYTHQIHMLHNFKQCFTTFSAFNSFMFVHLEMTLGSD